MQSNAIILGTAQLGDAYGIANRVGKLELGEAVKLVESALDSGIRHFDTAAAYRGSESILGLAFSKRGIAASVYVSTKGSISGVDAPSLRSLVHDSLRALRMRRLEHWFLHDEAEIKLWSAAFDEQALKLKRDGVVNFFGVSVYHLESALAALTAGCLNALQCPANPFDRRFLRSKALQDLVKNGGQIVLRSVFLQGLCHLMPAQVPSGIKRGAEAVSVLDEFCQRHSLARDEFCLKYVQERSRGFASGLVVGLETQDQLTRNISLMNTGPLPKKLLDEWDSLWPDDVEGLIDPSAWRLQN